MNEEQLEAHMIHFIREWSIAIAKLTEQQVAEAIKQAIASGDFQRFINVGEQSQTVVYIPFYMEQTLRSRIVYLEDLLKQNNIEIPDA